MRWWNSNTDSTDLNLSKLQEILEDRRGLCAACHVVAKKMDTIQQLNNNNNNNNNFSGPI